MLDQFRRRSTANPLRVDHLLEQLESEDPDLAVVFRQALEGNPREFPTKRIALTMSEHGYRLSETAVQTWRRHNRV